MIKDKHIFKEILRPEQVEQIEEAPILMLIYKAIYMCLRILIDIRKQNESGKTQLKIQKKILDNPVIRPDVKINIKDKNEK